jgi:hypothetical protein
VNTEIDTIKDMPSLREKLHWLEFLSDEHEAFYTDMGYKSPVKIHGKVVAIQQFIFTYGIVVGLDEWGYSHRYCYPNIHEAAAGLITWSLTGSEEPTGYIKRK